MKLPTVAQRQKNGLFPFLPLEGNQEQPITSREPKAYRSKGRYFHKTTQKLEPETLDFQLPNAAANNPFSFSRNHHVLDSLETKQNITKKQNKLFSIQTKQKKTNKTKVGLASTTERPNAAQGPPHV